MHENLEGVEVDDLEFEIGWADRGQPVPLVEEGTNLAQLFIRDHDLPHYRRAFFFLAALVVRAPLIADPYWGQRKQTAIIQLIARGKCPGGKRSFSGTYGDGDIGLFLLLLLGEIGGIGCAFAHHGLLIDSAFWNKNREVTDKQIGRTVFLGVLSASSEY